MSATYPTLPFTTFPDSLQSFTLMQDILASDAEAVMGFQNAMQEGNVEEAQQYYAQIANADNKFINAQKMNALFNTCEALEKFYQSDIQGYVTNKQTEWQNILNNFTYMGVYNNTIQYQVNNWVTYTVQGVTQLYICIVQPPLGTAPTNTNYWRTFTVQGEQGASGIGVSFLGTWTSARNYVVNNCVSYNNALWNCIQPNSNIAPAIGSSYWRMIYQEQPVVYPVQVNQPTTAQTGDLWFEVIA